MVEVRPTASRNASAMSSGVGDRGGVAEAVERPAARARDAAGEGVGDRRVERLARGAGQDRGRRLDAGEPDEVEADEGRVGQRGVALAGEEVAGLRRQPVPCRVAGDRAQERLRGAGRAARSDGPRPCRRPASRTGAGSPRRRPDRTAAPRRPASRRAPGVGPRAPAPRRRRSSRRGRLPARSPARRDTRRGRGRGRRRRAGPGRRAGTCPCPAGRSRGPSPRPARGELGREPAELGRVRQRAGQQEDRRRPRAGHPPADLVAPGPGEDPGGPAVDEGAHGLATELAAGRPRHGVEPDDRGRHLVPGERVAAGAEDRVVAGVGRVAAGARWPRPAPGPARPPDARPRRRPRSTAALVSTASTSAGETFSPPRTIRSVRRSTTVQPAGVVEPPEVAGADRAVARRLADVAGEPRRRGDDDLADPVGVRVRDRDRHARQRPAGARRVRRRPRRRGARSRPSRPR